MSCELPQLMLGRKTLTRLQALLAGVLHLSAFYDLLRRFLYTSFSWELGTPGLEDQKHPRKASCFLKRCMLRQAMVGQQTLKDVSTLLGRSLWQTSMRSRSWRGGARPKFDMA